MRSKNDYSVTQITPVVQSSKMRQIRDSIELSSTPRIRRERPVTENYEGANNLAYTSNSNSSTPRNSMGAIPIATITAGDSTLKNNSRKFQVSAIPPRSPTPIGSLYSMNEMTKEERTAHLRKNLTVMFSSIYAVFLVVLGGVIYINFQTYNKRTVSEVFSACVSGIGLLWLVFFHVDLCRYKSKILKMMMQWKEEQIERASIATDYNQMIWEQDGNIDPPYRFLTGRHSGSFYLKAGLAAFCFGHLINEGLQLGQEVLNYVQEDRRALNCGSASSIIIHCLRPIYSFYQLFIIFKYSNIVINRYTELARFALMHIIATCLCFWFSAIVEEAHEDYNDKLEEMEHHNLSVSTPTANSTGNYSATSCAHLSNAILTVNNIQAIPYLYPFTVEFNILLAGVWFIVWHNIGKHHHKANPHHFRHKIHNDDGIEEITFQSNLVINADCHASNKGLFIGLFLLMTSIISVIVFFVAMTSEGYARLGLAIHTTQELVLSLATLVGVLIAYWQLSKLDFNLHPITFLDDVLLFVPLPFYFVHSILSIAADATAEEYLRVGVSVLTVIQVILQTPFISDGLRRCSNRHGLRYQKPGREIVTFLIVCNLTLWIINTFEAKSVEPHREQHKYFGTFVWMFIGHTTLPLMLFYRFHSSVCLADIWKSSYEKGE